MDTEAVPISDPDICIIVINCNVKHNLSDSEYPKRRKRCEEAAKILGLQSLRDASLSLLECKNILFLFWVCRFTHLGYHGWQGHF